MCADGVSAAAEELATRKGEDAGAAQQMLGQYFEMQYKLDEAVRWWKLALENGYTDIKVTTAPSSLYLRSRQGESAAAEALIFSSTGDAGDWQIELGKDMEIVSPQLAEKAWAAAQRNGKQAAGPRKNAFVLWVCRHWFISLCLLLMGWSFLCCRLTSQYLEAQRSFSPSAEPRRKQDVVETDAIEVPQEKRKSVVVPVEIRPLS